MNKSAIIRVRVEPTLKAHVEAILDDLGLTTSQAITLFLKQVELQHSLPFQVNIPNKETAQVLKESEQGVNIVKSKNMAELFKKTSLSYCGLTAVSRKFGDKHDADNLIKNIHGKRSI